MIWEDVFRTSQPHTRDVIVNWNFNGRENNNYGSDKYGIAFWILTIHVLEDFFQFQQILGLNVRVIQERQYGNDVKG